MYAHGNTSAKDIVFDLARLMCTGNSDKPDNYKYNWKMVYPKIGDWSNIDSYPDIWSSTPSETTMNNLKKIFHKPDERIKNDSGVEVDVTTDNTVVYDKVVGTGKEKSTVVLECQAKLKKKWIKNEFYSGDTRTAGTTGLIKLTLRTSLAPNGNIRIRVRGKKYSLYRVDDPKDVKVIEFYTSPAGTSEVILPASYEDAELYIDYEAVDGNTPCTYYLELTRPASITYDDDPTRDGQRNYYYLTWKIGSKFDIDAVYGDDETPGVSEPPWLDYQMKQETKLSWFKTSATYVQEWLPIEYWVNITDENITGVIMGDPGISATDYISSPFYFGRLEQIEGALETDDKGNFAGFSGSEQNPQVRNSKSDNADAASGLTGQLERLKMYGDYTGTGTTDIILVSSKGGIPFQGNKVGLFGMYEFKEQTFNGQSAFTNKHAVTDIVVANVNENERGILANCIGVPKNGKEHGVELVADRYISEKEQTYIFLHINAPYTPFNTGNDVLIGFAIRTDN